MRRMRDTLILSHLDGDIARLVRVRQALEHSGTTVRDPVLPLAKWVSWIRYMGGGGAQLREIGMPDLEEALGIGAGERTDEGS